MNAHTHVHRYALFENCAITVCEQSKRYAGNYIVNANNNSEYQDNRCNYISLAAYVRWPLHRYTSGAAQQTSQILFYESFMLHRPQKPFIELFPIPKEISSSTCICHTFNHKIVIKPQTWQNRSTDFDQLINMNMYFFFYSIELTYYSTSFLCEVMLNRLGCIN